MSAARAPRVALVRGRYDAAGGAERFVQGALAALRAQGASITIVAREWPNAEGTALRVDPFYLGGLWRDWGFARAVCRELATQRFDLVQSHERIACCDVYRAGDGVHAQWLEQRARAQGPLARRATRASPRHRFILGAERALFSSPRLKAVICNSNLVLEDIARRFGTPRAKLVLIRNAVDASRFDPALREPSRTGLRQALGIPPAAHTVLHVGSGFERKGVAGLLAAVARAQSQPWAIVAGRDKHAARYRALARRLGMEARVRFVGSVSDVAPYYAAADAFALATLYDPQPNAALEAMACALPIVTTPLCGAAELLAEGESGFVRDALDTAGLAAAIDATQGEAGRRIGAAARASVLPYTPEAMAAQYVALYRRLLHG